MTTDQIAAEAAKDACAALGIENWREKYTIAVPFIKTAIEKDRLKAYDEGFKDGALAANRPEYRAAHASEEPFDPIDHHPSCTLSDQDLMWVCSQCGHKEGAK